MSHTHPQSKLYLTAGAFFSMAAFVLAGLAALPQTEKPVGLTAAAVAYESARDVVPKSGPLGRALVEASETLAMSSDVSTTSRVIIADLTEKSIVLIEGTTTIATYPILSIGREGTFWETPSGNYSIGTKEPEHRSIIGGTWMPWSMQFYGNYFIHGWPTHDDGTPVPKGYSGGCIRLDTADAKKLYDFVSLGTKVHIRGSRPPQQVGAHYYMNGTDPLPDAGARAFLVTDMASGDVLWAHAIDAELFPGRLVSFMTALVSAETIDQYKWIDYEKFVTGGDVSKASKNNPASVQIGALLYPLIYDGNDTAAQGIAAFNGVKTFRRAMNEKSRAIGMEDTVWGGASSKEVSTSTVKDLGRLLSYIDAQKSYIIKTSLTKSHSFGKNGVERYEWDNSEPLLEDGEYQGGLVARGDDGSGDAMVIFSLPLSEFQARRVGVVVVGAKNIEDTIAVLKNNLESRFTYNQDAKISGSMSEK